jgi:hypothetical protein
MFGYGLFEFPVDRPVVGGAAPPRWVRLALLGPFLLFLAFALTSACGLWYPPLFGAAVISVTLGFGSVLVACLYHLIAKLASRRT